MDVTRYQQIADALLKRHYSIGINDTDLSDLAVAQPLAVENYPPYLYINEFVEDFGLVRTDENTWLPSATINQADQDRIMAELGFGPEEMEAVHAV